MASMHRVDGDGILSRFIAQGCVVGRSSAMRDPLSTVHIDTNDNLARLFSGDSKSNFNRGKKRSLTATNHNAKINSKAVAFKFYLLPKNTLSTPLPVEELELLQAGMGEQMVSLPENGDHTEISRLLAETFPKMEGLCGGWLLHKAKGGSGRRKLIAIPLEAEGYTTKGLRAMAAGGQPTFYIVPLQETLDTAPLPPNSSHFSKMPKTACYQCNKLMPFQMLAVHIKTCKENLSDDDDESDDESSDDTCVVESKCKVVCPICNKEFPEDEIKVHATLCGERLEDVLLFLTQQIDTTSEFKLCVDREDLLDRGLRQWKRRKTASPASVLKVVYIGEADIDTEAIRKEFLTEMISGIEKRFFEGAGTQGKTPKYSLTDLDNDNFRTIGEIMAVSLAQGGPPPAFLKEWCYNFLCLGEIYCQSLSKDDVTDSESCVLISRVEDSTDVQSLMIYADKIINCGYTSQIKLDCKERIIQAIVKHSATRVIPMLQQLRKGMELYGLVNQMASNPAACHSLFVPGKITEGMVIPSLDEGVKVSLESRDKDVHYISDIKQTIYLQRVVDIMITQERIQGILSNMRDIKFGGIEVKGHRGARSPLRRIIMKVLESQKRSVDLATTAVSAIAGVYASLNKGCDDILQVKNERAASNAATTRMVIKTTTKLRNLEMSVRRNAARDENRDED
nr:uncharacterized protein LOC133580389 [Nerophis lumbriciformis]